MVERAAAYLEANVRELSGASTLLEFTLGSTVVANASFRHGGSRKGVTMWPWSTPMIQSQNNDLHTDGHHRRGCGAGDWQSHVQGPFSARRRTTAYGR